MIPRIFKPRTKTPCEILRWELTAGGRLYVVFRSGRYRSDYSGLRELREGEDVFETTDFDEERDAIVAAHEDAGIWGSVVADGPYAGTGIFHVMHAEPLPDSAWAEDALDDIAERIETIIGRQVTWNGRDANVTTWSLK